MLFRSWDIVELGLPGYDSTSTLYGGGEQYAIDAVGNNVAIVTGGIGENVSLWKSTDNGTTFTKTLVDAFPYVPENNGTPLGFDSVPTNDGSVAVVIDPNGKRMLPMDIQSQDWIRPEPLFTDQEQSV